jgi:hypothetical protein
MSGGGLLVRLESSYAPASLLDISSVVRCQSRFVEPVRSLYTVMDHVLGDSVELRDSAGDEICRSRQAPVKRGRQFYGCRCGEFVVELLIGKIQDVKMSRG